MYKGLVRRCKLLIISSVAFVILTGLAMISYPGGSLIDKSSIHYNFFENFFSDLGSTYTISGKKNTFSNLLFITALGGFGIILIYFSKIWRALDTDIHKHVLIGYLSKVFLILSGLFFIGIAFTPWNVYFENHVIFFKLAFSSLLIWTLLIIFLQLENKKIRNLIIINSVYVLILASYLYILFNGPKFGTMEELEFQALTQKIIVYATITNLTIQAIGINRFLRSADFRRDGQRNFYV